MRAVLDSMLSRDNRISQFLPSESSQNETRRASEAAHPPAGPGQPTSPPWEVLEGRAAAPILSLDLGNGVTGNKARQRVTFRNESQGQSCLLSSASSSSITAESSSAKVGCQFCSVRSKGKGGERMEIWGEVK